LKIRIKFSKRGNIRFIGHLDMMRYFQKCMRRADIPIRYSDGFSPHQIMSFAAPLGLGTESDAEYMDIEITEDIDRAEAVKRLNDVMCDGVKVLDWKVMPDNSKTAMSQMESADYLVICGDVELAPLQKDEIPVTKENKKTGESKTVDIKPMIYEIHKVPEGVFMHIAQGSSANLKPSAVMELLGTGYDRIIRKEIYDSNGLTL